MDAEWQPFALNAPPAILQLSNEHTAYLIDMLALKNNPTLDQILTEVFTNPKTLCLGFSFKGDLDKFGEHYPKMFFYKHFANFIDVQDYFKKVLGGAKKIGLAKCV